MTQPRRAPDPVSIRPLRPEDATDVAACTRIALGELYPEDVSPAELAIRVVSGTARVAHLQRTDPDGCWVAECDGRVVGAALGLILSSSHPAAIRRYARSPGFALVPTVGMAGIVDSARLPATLRCRAGDLAADAETIEAAADLLWGAMTSGVPGTTVAWDFVTAANQWAIQTGLAAGLAVTGCGPLFVRGQVGPMAPYLPNGPYL